ncbi:MAG: septal ring lytic transglycosylase RlpA family protein [Gammaproteobacteria bacterium]|nr:septal ring lytic transglycosylase RlpA family protein [Gammaproteobacteria bacterium]
MADDSPDLEPINLSEVKPVIPVPLTRTLAGNKSPYTVNGLTYHILPTEVGYEETGDASWYGRKFHGHLTSNGEIYDMFSYTAAHKSLPIPSFLEVTNLENGRNLMVRVNDRGPFHGNRIVDLSFAAATYLGYAENGTTRVRIRAVVAQPNTPGSNSGLGASDLLTNASEIPDVQAEVSLERERIEQDAGTEYLQVGAFSNLESAGRLLAQIRVFTALPIFIRSDADGSNGSLLHRVRLGPLNETIELSGLIQIIKEAGLGTPFRVRQ